GRPYYRGSKWRGLIRDPVCLDRLSDILDLLRAEIDESHRQLRPDLVLHGTRDANSARLCKSFQASRDVYCVAEQVLALHHDVADVDADAEPHLLLGRSIPILLGYGVLHLNSTLHG